MAVAYVDELMAYVADPSNRGAFLAGVGLAAFAGVSFTRRYGLGGFQVDGVTLGEPEAFQLQEPIVDDGQVVGSRELRTQQPERHAIDYRVRAPQAGWTDVAFAVPATFALHAVPGSLLLGPSAGVAPAGTSTGPAPGAYGLKFAAAVGTDAFTLTYKMNTFIFAAGELSPRDDLRRIRGLRRSLESAPSFLASLDGPPGQRPYLFVQAYPPAAANGGGLSQAAVVQLFDAADVLAVFFTIPGV